MNKPSLALNLEKLIKAKNLSMKGLSLAAGLNETAVRDIIKGRVKSPNYRTLSKLSLALGCKINDLVEDSTELLPRLTFLNTKILLESIIEVDMKIALNHIPIGNSARAELYVKCYEMNILYKQNNT